MRSLLVVPLLLALAGCNWISNVSGLSKDANKAVGAACRQSGRSLEECYQRNPDADKAQIYAGWREMHEYMVKQKLETIAPPPEPAAPPVAANGAHKPEASAAAAQPDNKPHAQLTPAEADRAMRNDPQVAAVLAAIKRGGLPPPPPSSSEKGPSDEKKQLLDVIKQLNKKGGNAASPAG